MLVRGIEPGIDRFGFQDCGHAVMDESNEGIGVGEDYGAGLQRIFPLFAPSLLQPRHDQGFAVAAVDQVWLLSIPRSHRDGSGRALTWTCVRAIS